MAAEKPDSPPQSESAEIKKYKQKKKKKQAKWDMEEHIGSVSVKLKTKFKAEHSSQEKLIKAGWQVNRRGKVMALNGDKPTLNDCPETYLVQQFVSSVISSSDYYNFTHSLTDARLPT